MKADIKYLERKNCLICGGADLTKIRDIYDWDSKLGSFSLLSCPCGMFFTSPYPAEESLPALYAAHALARNLDAGGNALFKKLKAALIRRGIKKCAGYFPKGKIIFADIGTGLARVPVAMREMFPGADITCTDFGPRPAALNAPGLEKIKYLHNDEFFKSAEKYNIIMLHHVIEHAPDPQIFLKRVMAKLSADGILIIETPNIKSAMSGLFGKYSSNYNPPYHICHFTRGNMKSLVDKSGYDIALLSQAAQPLMSNIAANFFGAELNNFFRFIGIALHPAQILLSLLTGEKETLFVIVKHK